MGLIPDLQETLEPQSGVTEGGPVVTRRRVELVDGHERPSGERVLCKGPVIALMTQK